MGDSVTEARQDLGIFKTPFFFFLRDYVKISLSLSLFLTFL